MLLLTFRSVVAFGMVYVILLKVVYLPPSTWTSLFPSIDILYECGGASWFGCLTRLAKNTKFIWFLFHFEFWSLQNLYVYYYAIWVEWYCCVVWCGLWDRVGWMAVRDNIDFWATQKQYLRFSSSSSRLWFGIFVYFWASLRWDTARQSRRSSPAKQWKLKWAVTHGSLGTNTSLDKLNT